MTGALPAGAHGGDGRALSRRLGLDPDDVIDLSASLNPVAPDPGVAVAAHLGALGRYPDATEATEALATTMGVPVDRLVLTNGGAEAIALVGRIIGGRVEEPDFSLYPRGPADADEAIEGVGVPLWRSNPHSPSGCLAADDERAEVWDEAFWPLTTGTWTRGDADRGSVVLGSLTKLLACPGLRVGYLLVPDSPFGEQVRDRVLANQPAWSLGGLVCEALPDLLATVRLEAWAADVAARRDGMATELTERGFHVEVADAPWLLIHDRTLRDRLGPHGIVLRDCGSFGMAGVARMAVPTDAQIGRLRRALDQIAPNPSRTP